MRKIIRRASFVFALISLGLTTLVAQEKTETKASPSSADRTESPDELVSIRLAADAFVAAFNEADAKKLSTLWVENGDYVDEVGTVHTGREAIEKGFAQFFADHPNVKMRITIDSLRLLNDSAAVEDGRAVMEPPTAGAPGTGKYTAIHVKDNGQWLLSSLRDHHVEIPSSYAKLADLEFLIGTWDGEKNGEKLESTCGWVANKSFVQRNFSTTTAAGEVSTGVQLIGWNAQDNRIQSWTFNADGGHATGIWSQVEGGWSTEMHGITGNGIPTSAINLLWRLDDNAYAWQSIERTIGGEPLPNSEEVVLKRRSPSR